MDGIECSDRDLHAVGGFADVYCGLIGRKKVALKRLRTFQMVGETTTISNKLKKVRSAHLFFFYKQELTRS